MGFITIEMAFYILEAIVAVSFVAGIFYVWKQTRKSKHQRHAHNVVDSLGVKYLRDVVLPDGIDGLVFIDYLLLVNNGFVVLNTENSEGHLFGGETVDQWSQVINNKTYKFNNPLYANQSACQAVLWNLQHHDKQENVTDHTQWQAQGWVVFSSAGNFPKGIPEHVSMIDGLANNLAPLINDKNPADEKLLNAWRILQETSASTQAENKP
jgi:hypothetical protein